MLGKSVELSTEINSTVIARNEATTLSPIGEYPYHVVS